MDLIDESQKKLYETCKYKVKIWEHKFKKENGRLPSKLDIKEAESEVRNAYKTYFQIKTAALEHSFMGVDGFNSDEEQEGSSTTIASSTTNTTEGVSDTNFVMSDKTWGAHLNKQRPEKKIEKPLVESLNLNLAISKKLSFGSKLIKRNPRKSLVQVKSDSCINLNTTESLEVPVEKCSISQPIISSHPSFDSGKSTEILKNTKIVSMNGFIPSQSVNLFPKLLRNDRNSSAMKKIDIEWLERAENSTKSNISGIVTKAAVISDEDIIDNSDDESIRDSFHIAKKLKSSTTNIDKEFGVNLEKKTEEDANGEINIALDKTEANKIVKNGQSDSDDELSAKVRKRNKNENFVRINLKKKIYARGKKTQTFSKFKKKQWKDRKKFLANDGGDFPEKKGKFCSDKLLPLDSNVGSEDELLTLNQASKHTDVEDKLESDSEEDNLTLAEIKIISKEKQQGIKQKSTNENQVPKIGKNDRISRQRNLKVDTNLEQNENQPIESLIKENKERVKERKPSRHGSLTKIKKKSSKRKDHLLEHKNSTRRHKTVSQNIGEKKQEAKYVSETTEELPYKFSNINEHLFDPDEDYDLLLETIRIEHTLKSKGVSPLYAQNEDGTIIEANSEVLSALKLFGHSNFRQGQERAVMRILSGKSTLVTLSTGSGKSLCYQLPAYLFRQKYECITLVVSPLISLMEDQLKCIPGVLSAACLHSNQTKNQRDQIIKSVISGEINVLMVSPESIISSENSSGFGSVLARLPPIAFACLDEAHCLSQWSHNFRPSYLVVCRVLQETFGVKTILGLTATSTKKTTNSLIAQLKIPDGVEGVIKDTPVPANLSLSVSKDANRDQALLELLHSEPFSEFKSIIIYCLRREECEKVASFLRTTLKDHGVDPSTNSKKRKRMSLQAEPYHAGISGSRRKSVQKAFMSGELRIVVATIAFGMGINMPDLRSVIHYRMPGKFESYVQEIGRAGRDGLPAHCHVFLDRLNTDVFELRRHIYGNSVDRHIIRKLLRKVFISCDCKDECFKHEVMFSIESTVRALDIPQEIISTLLCYLELHERNYIKMLRPCYSQCKILSYGGRALLNKFAENCEPLRIALQKYGNEDDSNIIEFPIFNVSRILKYDSGMCKQILKNLEWININGQPKRSGLKVEFSDLSFHLLSPGNLPDGNLDEVLDSLHKKVMDQENTAYSQLIHINEKLSQVASLTFTNALEDNEEKSEILKESIRHYFESDESLNVVDIPDISDNEKHSIASDVRCLIGRYSDENFTGRSVARIFHGIASPNFPPHIWGRTKFWRSHLKIHFNTICKIATQEIIKMQ